MENSWMLPLRPPADKRDRKDDLPVRIAQINAQRGSFRNVTEEGLQNEIDARKEKGRILDEEEAKVKPPEVDTTKRLDLLYKRRAEIIQYALQAHMETTFALDFISLLLSKHTPRQADLSMSAHLKQMVPQSSLNLDIVKSRQKPDSAKQDPSFVSRGWKLESFNGAANKLLKSAARLGSEVASETTYWDELLAVREKGWKICRLPRERQALGVQYGFLEAAPHFRDRGLAPLRRADGGHLILDRGTAPSRPKVVRVRVTKDGQVTGWSNLSRFMASDGDSIEDRILQGRDALYEEELFYELNRESRIMGSSGVIARHNLLQFEYNKGKEILLDLIDPNEVPIQEGLDVQKNDQNVVADAVAHTLRILLSYAHRQNLRRRTQIPPPLTLKKRPLPEYLLLRPVAAALQHNAHIQSLQLFLGDVFRILKAAGFQPEFTAIPFSSVDFSQSRPSASTVEAVVEKLLEPLESSFSGTLITEAASFTVKIRTNLSPPFQGTEYEFSISLPSFPYIQPPSRMGLKDEVEGFITHLITIDLISHISSISAHMPKMTSRSAFSRRDHQPSQIVEWEAPFAEYGELLAFSHTASAPRGKKLFLRLSREELTILASWSSAKPTVREPEERRLAAVTPEVAPERGGRLSEDRPLYTWRADDPPGRRVLMDVVFEASRELLNGR